ncbi:MAG TPA: hypothetical protein VGD91_01755 [Trebonia sp.]
MSRSHHQVARDTATTGVTGVIWTLAVVPPFAALLQTLTSAQDYRQSAVPVAVWLGVLGASLWLVPRLRPGSPASGGLSPAETTAAIAIAVAAVAAVGLARPANAPVGRVDLAILGTAWLLVLVLLSRPPWVWLPAALLVFGVHGVLLVRDEGPHRIVLSELTAAGYIIVAALLAFTALRSALDLHIGLAARQAELAGSVVAERAAETAVQRERRGRLAALEQEALPLLRAIADGALDPSDQRVQEQCAQHATILRQSLAGVPEGRLAAGLEPALRAAETRGVTVTVQLIGDPGTTPGTVTQAAATAVDAVLGALTPQQAVLTVLEAGDDVELYLTFRATLLPGVDLEAAGAGLPAAAGWHCSVSVTEDGEGCLEASWRKDGAD